jgi:voltage-gated potassium channel Kch
VTHKQSTGLGRKLRAPTQGYTALLLSILALWMLSPFLAILDFEEVSEAFLITVTVVAASYAMADQGKSFLLIIGLGVLLVLAMWIDAGRTHRDLGIFSAIAGLLFYGVVAYELLVDILSKESRVNLNLINGAISVYLLIGICFAHLYALVFTLDPSAFRGIEVESVAASHFTYFSFVTLTTLGYGDITPLTRASGNFAILEATVGQLYLTVLVARLVGMHISQETAG